MMLKEKVIHYAQSIGVDLIGFTTAEPFEDLRKILEEREKLGYLSGFEEKDIDLRITPRKIMDNAESIIVIGVPYFIDGSNHHLQSNPEFYGELARMAWGTDYHVVVQDKLQKIACFLQKEEKDFQYKMYVDTGPLVDRHVAYRAGLGHFGFNSTLINNRYGSWFFIGYMLTNFPFEPDKALVNTCCDACNLCIKHCPTGAIEGPYQLNASKCVSAILQKRKEIPEDIRGIIGRRLYGCDICQEVCPHNFKVEESREELFIPSHLSNRVDLLQLLNISNKGFKEMYGKSACRWIGKKVLQRNAIIALANHKREEAISYIIPLLKDGRPEIRKYAIWGIFTLNPDRAYPFLEEMKKEERDEEVLQVLKNYLEKFKDKDISGI